MPEQYLHGIEVLEIDDGTRPIQTVKSSVIGLIGTAPDADADAFPPDQPVLITGSPRQATALGAAGTLKQALDGIFDQCGAMVVVIRVQEGADEAATLSNLVGDAAAMTGVHGFLAAESEVNATPRILCAPGFTHQRPDGAANPVVSELSGIASRLRAVIIVDGPNGTMQDAVIYRKDWGSDRIFVVDPWAKVWNTAADVVVARPASGRVSGMISGRDNERGFWWSPSNQTMNGIVGVSRPVDFSLSDVNSQANFLNENEVATIIHRDGYRLWGNRTTASDPLFAFLSVRRTCDMVYESIEEALLWAMDRPMSANLIHDVQESVAAYLRHLTAQGALLGGTCWLDEELNTKELLMAGKLYLDFDLEPPAPLEHLTFRAHRENGYYEELVSRVQSAQ
ncbi:phage tail sheath subtilisin-like domain-containing protein [Desulfocurvus sp. DL9XJH121]